jgi:elongation factor Ts
MSTITTEQVKELRDKTGVSVMQCRKALEETDGDMEKALVILRKKGAELAEKKSDRTASDGLIVIKSDGKRALSLILNCETDFVAKNEDFVALANSLLDIAWNEGPDAARAQAAEKINDVVLKIGENIQLGTIDEVSGDVVGAYVHHTGKTAAVVSLTGANPDVARDIAMHVAAMRPAYKSSADIDAEAKAAATEVFKKEVEESGKPAEIKEKMLEGKLAGYFQEQTLLDQPFFKNPDVTIQKYAGDNGGTVDTFVVYSVSI